MTTRKTRLERKARAKARRKAGYKINPNDNEHAFITITDWRKYVKHTHLTFVQEVISFTGMKIERQLLGVK